MTATKVSSKFQHDPGKHTVNADIRIGQCASPLVPIYPHDTALVTIPESGTPPAWYPPGY